MEVCTFVCEWDIGINDRIFVNEDIARNHVSQALCDSGIEESLAECEIAGLIYFETKHVIGV